MMEDTSQVNASEARKGYLSEVMHYLKALLVSVSSDGITTR
jgi:hypothetical protein